MADDLAGLCYGEMQLPPASSAVSAMFGNSPFTFTEHCEAGTVDDEVDRTVDPGWSQSFSKRAASAREGGVVGRVEMDVHQVENRSHEAFGLPKR